MVGTGAWQASREKRPSQQAAGRAPGGGGGVGGGGGEGGGRAPGGGGRTGFGLAGLLLGSGSLNRCKTWDSTRGAADSLASCCRLPPFLATTSRSVHGVPVPAQLSVFTFFSCLIASSLFTGCWRPIPAHKREKHKPKITFLFRFPSTDPCQSVSQSVGQ